MKCAGLTHDQLKLRSAPPSTLSLLGLVRHMTDVERAWFRRRTAGQDGPEVESIYRAPDRPDADFDDLDTADVETTMQVYLDEVERCRQAAAPITLDRVVGDRSVRWIYLHMIEEYARHNGHADLLRERIDGTKGA
jgi:hypothetical protein